MIEGLVHIPQEGLLAYVSGHLESENYSESLAGSRI